MGDGAPKTALPDADAVDPSGRQHRPDRYRESRSDLAGSKNTSMYTNHSARENREIWCSPAARTRAGREGKAKAVIPR